MALRRKVYIILLAAVYLAAFSGFIIAGDIKVKIKKYPDDKTGLVWVSVPSGMFKTLSDAAAYINKEGVQVSAVLKQIPEKNVTARYSYMDGVKKWIGSNFTLGANDAIGLIIKGKKAYFTLPETWKSIKMELKGGNTYAVSIPPRKYRNLSDIAASIGGSAAKIGVWSAKKGGRIYIENKNNVWEGTDAKIEKHDAVFITIKDSVKSLIWTP